MKYREINAIHGRLRNLSQMRQRAHPVLPESGEVFQRGLYADHIPQQVRFKGKNGKAFDASLVLDGQFNVAFSFPEKKGKPKK